MVLYIFPPELFIVSPDSAKKSLSINKWDCIKISSKHPEKIIRGIIYLK